VLTAGTLRIYARDLPLGICVVQASRFRGDRCEACSRGRPRIPRQTTLPAIDSIEINDRKSWIRRLWHTNTGGLNFENPKHCVRHGHWIFNCKVNSSVILQSFAILSSLCLQDITSIFSDVASNHRALRHEIPMFVSVYQKHIQDATLYHRLP
jgi:hypothetical protein